MLSGIVAFGGQQKTTFTIGRNEQIFIGPTYGDLENRGNDSAFSTLN